MEQESVSNALLPQLALELIQNVRLKHVSTTPVDSATLLLVQQYHLKYLGIAKFNNVMELETLLTLRFLLMFLLQQNATLLYVMEALQILFLSPLEQLAAAAIAME